VLLQRIEARGFLSFGLTAARLNVDPVLTVVTGPNAAGKSNLGRCLDVARAVLAPHGHPEAERLDLYQDAGYEGTTAFTIRLDIELDQPWERHLIWAYVCSCFATSQANQDAQTAERLEAAVTDRLDPDSLAPLLSGSLVIGYRATADRPWAVAWEFADAGKTWHAVLAGDEGLHQLRPGTAGSPGQADSAGSFTDWLTDTKPQDEDSLDFQNAMQNTTRPLTFMVPTVTGRSGWLPASLRALGSYLGLKPEGRMFSFDQVIWQVLQRGIVLTDNRRLPLTRRFPIADLGHPADLRDGAAVGAELFRLKNGDPQERERFQEIRATFRQLTDRDLEVRARPAPPDDGDAAMIIEPTVVGLHGERLVEFSGAGIQEALVLSALLQGSPGRVTVLDEPAVNLEPTVQRRLTGRVRGPGQYLVITHSADLVPFEEQTDLARIARVAPGPAGSQIYQPDYADLRLKDHLRQLQLLEPAEVRSLLFARAVILFEGQTEVGALPRWWRKAPDAGLPDPGAANISIITVYGHSGYGPYIRFLDTFGVPWAILTDGPALRLSEKLAKVIQEQRHWPGEPEPDDAENFAQWREFWEHAGVFTVADRFGDDRSKGGELEALLQRIDSRLLARARKEVGDSKPRIGRYFAIHHPDPPPEVLDIYKKISDHLGLARQSP
jgi:hypothetical protein